MKNEEHELPYTSSVIFNLITIYLKQHVLTSFGTESKHFRVTLEKHFLERKAKETTRLSS